MAKKRKNFMEAFDGEPMRRNTDGGRKKVDINGIMEQVKKDPMIDAMLNSIPEEGRETFMRMFELALMGVTPDEYESFYRIVEIFGSPSNKSGSGDDSGDIFPMMPMPCGRSGAVEVKEYPVMENAMEKTILLKIQMKNVTKPPMWREVEVPADIDFEQLHKVIQSVNGLENHHLWQFNARAYDDSLQIGLSSEDDGDFDDADITDEASETPITRFLHQKGDSLEYVYDFGDNWIFTVEVKNVVDRKSEYPRCVKYKSELNAIEDFGGPWNYVEAREDLANWGSLKKKERKERLEMNCFDSENEYLEFLNFHLISIDDVNDDLRTIL